MVLVSGGSKHIVLVVHGYILYFGPSIWSYDIWVASQCRYLDCPLLSGCLIIWLLLPPSGS